MLEIDATRIPEVTGDIQGFLGPTYAGGVEQDDSSYAKLHIAIKGDAEMVLDVFAEPEAGGGRHVLIDQGERYALEHSLRCRRAGLQNCTIDLQLREDGPPYGVEPGRWEIWLDEDGDLAVTADV